jgi:hypothetical protein
MLFDLFALMLQSAGGAIAGGSDISRRDTGLSVLQAGLAAHLAAMVAFIGLAADIGFRVYRHRETWDTDFKDLQPTRKFRAFLLGMMRPLHVPYLRLTHPYIGISLATLGIFIRTTYRVAELSQGFDSELAQNETAFLVLEGGMVLGAVILLTTFHPGIAFQGRWADADFQLKGTKMRQGAGVLPLQVTRPH